MEKNISSSRKKRLSIYLLMGMTIIVMFSASYALFSDTVSFQQTLTSGTMDVEQQLFVNGTAADSGDFYIESGEINNIKLEITNSNGVKVRTESYLQVALPEGTPTSSIQGLYVYDAALTDEQIKTDLASGQPILAITPTIVQQEAGKPVVLQYAIPNSKVSMDASGTATVNAKLVLAEAPDITYQGIYGEVNAVVVALQYDNTVDADLANYVPAPGDIQLESNVVPTGITLDQTSITMTPSMSGEVLKPTITPANAYDRTVTWTSSDPSIAKVDQNGIVIAYAPGTTTITATTCNGFTATCNVVVQP